jgi:hypothetical protein
MKDKSVDCTCAEELLSAYVDSMTSPEEVVRLEAHLVECAPCKRQLQSLISLRNMLARIEPVAPPEDLVLDTRVKLSQVRNRSYFDWLDAQLNNVLKPLAMPVLFGVSLTMLFFGLLFGNIVSTTTVLARDLHAQPSPSIEKALVASDGNPQLNNPGAAEFASNTKPLDELLTLSIDINAEGQAVDYRIVSGKRSEAWVKEFLSLARFTPATAFGAPVSSTIILAFVDVRG